MINKINITVPEPCGEKWNVMTNSEKGKFCALCQKNVIDFTSFTDREILNYYNLNSKICGRFNSDQLNRNLILPKEKSSFWMLAAASIISFFGFGIQTAKAQQVVKTEQTDNKTNRINSEKNKKNNLEVITGIVTDGASPIPGVYVSTKDSKRKTETDLYGNYTIEVKKRDVLVFSYIGYKSVEQKISGNKKINICLKEVASLIGEVVIVKKVD